ncbi:pentatricopeptide repeat-containing protein At5g50390, chloroplastic-like [Tripterygium wilfordii]|uniref:pentatricopeptide repeat-containing protein At5g50390, chloroplastic-like n=1 Tax=Tripterygium wilfordii TaxID=458696 RepID=UPI0018F80B4D|nr:pentatricopeptide repeat-containing protein At5g50390, chloroplastic-like [Tripterygium wilfordii]
MEIPILRYQSISLDQIQDRCRSLHFSFSDPNYFKSKNWLSKYCFSFSRRKIRNPFDKIWCSMMPQGLKPRPKLHDSKVKFVGNEGAGSGVKRIKKPSAALCSQIEKSVFCGRYREAFELFEILEIEGGFDVDSSTYDALVSACIGLRSIRGVNRVFNYMISNGFEPDQYMRNRVLLMHVKCGMIIQALHFFDEMPERNLVTWDTMISGLVNSGSYEDAFRLFLIMWAELSDADTRTIATMIRASAGLGFISVGRQLHTCALKMGARDDIYVSCGLIDMYSKCGMIEDAYWVFDEMPEKTIVGWNSIIAGYALNGYSEEALNVYYDMRDSGVKLDHFTFSIIVRTCARLGSVEHAKQAHAGLIRHGFGSDIVANTTLVDFYSKWNRIEYARHVFDRMPSRNVLSWNALISGYGNHGRGSEAVEMFELMLLEGLKPNHVTFLAVLSACSHSGLSEHGWEIFHSMSSEYNVQPRAMHYACMIELLGREGLLNEAFALLKNAPVEPKPNMWAALLTACRVHGNLELGKLAAEKLYGMEPEKLNNYVVLLNLYNGSGKLKEAAAVLQTLKRKGLRMLPACTWIDIDNQSHCFLSGDKNHVQTAEIYRKVDELMLEISKHGNVPLERNLLPDVDEQEERILMYHSEKLAIAFGLLNTPYWTPLHIVQGHRICGDCHNAIRLISKVTERVIVVRDASRFHHFKNGACSCGDYW